MRYVKPNETPFAWLRVTYLREGREIRSVYLAEPVAIRSMALWTAQGPEYRCWNELVRLGKPFMGSEKSREPGDRRNGEDEALKWMRRECGKSRSAGTP
jgi:hypothetical protein